MKKTCKQCNKEFYVFSSELRRGWGKFCSRLCASNSKIGHFVSEETRRKIGARKKGQHHSEETKQKLREYMLGRDRGGYRRNCKTCGQSFRCNPSASTVNCSKECSSKYFSQFCGPKSHSWKGGLTPIHLADRRGIKYKEWRKAVLQRDHFTCQKTGIRGGKLVVHHIQNFSQFPELRFAVGNGITLSKKAHDEFHKIYGKKNNNREQLLEFLTEKRNVSPFYQPLFDLTL